MSIDHKAYLFKYDGFLAELALTLHAALLHGEIGGLRAFIGENAEWLTDPMTGEPLAENWEDGEQREVDVQSLADIALTKYYDIGDDRGLGYGFDALAAYLDSVPPIRDVGTLLITGRLFGPPGRRLDPGLMGTGLLTLDDVQMLLERIDVDDLPPLTSPESPIFSECLYHLESAESVRESLDRLRWLYRAARDEGLGLLLLDFNDCGVRDL